MTEDENQTYSRNERAQESNSELRNFNSKANDGRHSSQPLGCTQRSRSFKAIGGHEEELWCNYKKIGRRCTHINTQISALRQRERDVKPKRQTGAGKMAHVSQFYTDADLNYEKLGYEFRIGFAEKLLKNSTSITVLHDERPNSTLS